MGEPPRPAEELAELRRTEKEVIASILGDDFAVVPSTAWHGAAQVETYEVVLRPEDESQKAHVAVVVRLALTRTYPNSVPTVLVRSNDPRTHGLTAEQLAALGEALHARKQRLLCLEAVALGLLGVFIAGTGAMLAFAAQMSMGSSWRVGVAEGATGALVSGGLYRFSRNPTFVGQFMLLAGVGLAVPAVPTLFAPMLFLWAAATQVRSEETALRQALGRDYEHYLNTVPRWIGLHRGSAT